jgi:hypothetical protein
VSFSIHCEKSAKGTASGRLSRIVTGWTTDSNCAARMMYMNAMESMKAQMNS